MYELLVLSLYLLVKLPELAVAILRGLSEVLPQHYSGLDGLHGALDVLAVDVDEGLVKDVLDGVVAAVVAQLAEQQLRGEALHGEVRHLRPAEAVEEAVRAELEVVLPEVEIPADDRDFISMRFLCSSAAFPSIILLDQNS